jgi:hypothetical protein
MSQAFRFNYGGERGIDWRVALTLRATVGRPKRCFVEPRRGLSPSLLGTLDIKKPDKSQAFLFKYGGERGIDWRVALTLRATVGRPKRCFVEPRRGLSPSHLGTLDIKKPDMSQAFLFKYGGERGIRTLDTLPYTHFPGVLLQPLGHLTGLVGEL